MPANVRGRAACHQCRSRKQKCDEKRPTCSRCRDLNKPCQWPGSRKRGPAKGYTEALEHRLKETESALLRIVSVVDGATLQSAFEDSARGDYVDAPSDSNTDKAEKAAHWEQFPLSTPRDLVKWAVEQQVSQDRDAAPAPAAAMHPVRRTAVRFGQQLSEHDAAMEFETSFTKNVAEFAGNFATISTSLGDLPHGLRGNTEYQDDTFDMPEQFKQQYLW